MKEMSRSKLINDVDRPGEPFLCSEGNIILVVLDSKGHLFFTPGGNAVSQIGKQASLWLQLEALCLQMSLQRQSVIKGC